MSEKSRKAYLQASMTGSSEEEESIVTGLWWKRPALQVCALVSLVAGLSLIGTGFREFLQVFEETPCSSVSVNGPYKPNQDWSWHLVCDYQVMSPTTGKRHFTIPIDAIRGKCPSQYPGRCAATYNGQEVVAIVNLDQGAPVPYPWFVFGILCIFASVASVHSLFTKCKARSRSGSLMVSEQDIEEELPTQAWRKASEDNEEAGCA
eukprot:gb/GFBE01061095.1/.p1 GENE.gb/GFBE01061095.1/~~gb/GFBE01061095.1/.p1  ORF type:complete len:206 (+),score=22.83 gb/GFBE01061095.1/:1-618(+)